MNYIFISPNYPNFFYKFCLALKSKGVCVLGLGDSTQILSELKNSLNEYCLIPKMTDFSATSAVVEHLVSRYGKIDGVDSLNEFWLETESRLREKFSIAGTCGELMQDYKFKSRMKKRFESCNVPVAPWVKSENQIDILDFAALNGFPLFCKPDNGVGAEGTHKFNCIDELESFLKLNDFSIYIFEPYVDGEIYSFDGLCDSDGEIVFSASHRFYTPIDKLKENGGECIYRTLTEVPPELFEVGIKSMKAFELKNSFFHIEFFKLNKPLYGVANVGEFVALEANMRIAGGYTAEMIYHALGLDIYGLWASVVCGEKPNLENYVFSSVKKTVVNVARKIGHNYLYTIANLKENFPQEFILSAETIKEENPFGNLEIIASFTDETRLSSFIEMAIAKV